MLGTFKDGQKHEFYVGLTEQILDFVRRAKDGNKRAFAYRGMDLSHAFESQLFFGTVLDPELNELFDRAIEGRAVGRAALKDPLAELMAEHWFGPPGKGGGRGMGHRLKRLARTGRWLVGTGFASASGRKANMPGQCDVLLYARSRRFADYMAPLATALPGRHAFLTTAHDSELQAHFLKNGTPFIAAASASPKLRSLRSLIGRFVPYVGFIADGVEAVLRETRPRVVIVVEGSAPDDEAINQVGRKLGIPVVCLQQGWSPILHAGFCNLSYERMYVWGEGFADLLQPSNPRTRFTATGNYTLAARLRAEKKAGVLFFHQDLDRGLGGSRGAGMMIDLACGIAEARPDVPVYFRPHPLVPLDDDTRNRFSPYPNLVIQESAVVPLAVALGNASVSVSIYSTTILESIAAGTMPIVFNMTSMPHYWPDIAASGAGLELRTTEEALAALERLLSDEAYLASFDAAMEAFTARFFVARGAEAVSNLVSELDCLAGVSNAPKARGI